MAERWWRLKQRLAGRGFYGDGYGWWDKLLYRLKFWKLKGDF